MTKNIKPIFITVLVMSIVLSFYSSQAYAQSQQEILTQYISDLQKNPNDNALREKIIKHVQTMKPAPAIPEEARRYFIEGNALLKAAKAQKGYGLAIDAYRQCLLIAPWWAEALYNYAVALDLANQFDEGMNALKLYIATNPGGEESRKAQDKIYEIGAKKKLAAQEREESSPQTVAAQEQKKSDDWLKKLDGRRYMYSGPAFKAVIDVRGKIFLVKTSPFVYERGYVESSEEATRFEILGRETTVPFYQRLPDGTTRDSGVVYTFIINEDGDRITWRSRWNDGHVNEIICLWQR